MGNSCSIAIPLRLCCSNKSTLLNKKTNYELNLPPQTLIKTQKDCNENEDDLKTPIKSRKSTQMGGVNEQY